jgi:hypothetical protein
MKLNLHDEGGSHDRRRRLAEWLYAGSIHPSPDWPSCIMSDGTIAAARGSRCHVAYCLHHACVQPGSRSVRVAHLRGCSDRPDVEVGPIAARSTTGARIGPGSPDTVRGACARVPHPRMAGGWLRRAARGIDVPS